MIQLMVNILRIIIAIFIALLFNSCKYDMTFGESITGSGHVVSKERTLDPFTKIEVSQGLDCEVTQSDQIKVVVEADDNLQDGIITTVVNGTLKIKSKYNSFTNVKSKKIKVYLPKIDALESTSASQLITKNIIKGTDVNLKTSSAGQLEANIESDKITLETSSGSTINVKGKALEVSTSSSSGSNINAENLYANDIVSESSSGSFTHINPILSLKASASSGSSILYVKSPKKISKSENSGSSIEQD